MNHEDFVRKLKKINACQEAIDLIVEQKWTLKQAWEKTERPDWMLWLMCILEFGTQKDRIHIICDCAETALKYVPKGEDRPRLAIAAARNYADDPTDVNRKAVVEAARAAEAAAWAAVGAVGAAAWAAARAARAAEAAAWASGAAGAASWVARAAVEATGAANQMCKMIRQAIKPAPCLKRRYI